ncbi:MAG: hypothetical protein ACKVOL_04030 [Novosphingobium sp.]
MTQPGDPGARGWRVRHRPARALAAALLLAGFVGCWTHARASAPAEPVPVITHTRQYCDELSERAASLYRKASPPLEEARLLAAEGDRLCSQGQIRPGIIRLRRAIMLLRVQAQPEAAGR